MTKQISFDVSRHEASTIKQIADRAVTEYYRYGVKLVPMDVVMDITACHANGNPLRLKAMLQADEFNFVHDVTGIANNLNRNTGKLENCFSPRFSQGSLTPEDKP